MDGINIGPSITPSFSGVNRWTEFHRTFTTGSAGTIDLSLVDLEAFSAGRDYALDDISLSQVPLPSGVWLFGSGLIGLVGLAGRKNSIAK